jgi:ATP adenylyltransferase
MGEFNENVWAPWRMEYIDGLSGTNDRGGCFLCDHFAHPDQDAAHRVVARSDELLMVMNKFPYTSGHLLVAPRLHVPRLADLPEAVLCASVQWVRDAQAILESALRPQGFNIGMNVGHCAGAGLPDHLHWHIVPRWGGDTNFMPLLGDVRVIPEALDRTYEKLLTAKESFNF